MLHHTRRCNQNTIQDNRTTGAKWTAHTYTHPTYTRTHTGARAHVFEAHGAADNMGEVLDSVREVGADVEHLVARGGVERCNRDRLQHATLNE
jgi:hypothetical protein